MVYGCHNVTSLKGLNFGTSIAHCGGKNNTLSPRIGKGRRKNLKMPFTNGGNLAIIAWLCTGGSMDRASDSGSEGWGFESLPVYHDAGSQLLRPSFHVFTIKHRKTSISRIKTSLRKCRFFGYFHHVAVKLMDVAVKLII